MSIIYDVIMYDKNQTKAHEKNLKSLHKVGEAEYKREEERKKMQAAVEKCAKRKRALITTSIKDFVELYSKIGRIKFQESEGINELEIIESKLPDIQVLTSATEVRIDVLDSKQETMLFLTRGFLGGAARSIRKESEQQLASANIIRRQADVIAAQYESIRIADELIYERVERITASLTEINRLLRKSNTVCNEIINKNGDDVKNYSQYEKDCLMTCVNTAKMLKDIIDVPIFEENGKISEDAEMLIDLGNNYMQEIKKIAVS